MLPVDFLRFSTQKQNATGARSNAKVHLITDLQWDWSNMGRRQGGREWWKHYVCSSNGNYRCSPIWRREASSFPWTYYVEASADELGLQSLIGSPNERERRRAESYHVLAWVIDWLIPYTSDWKDEEKKSFRCWYIEEWQASLAVCLKHQILGPQRGKQPFGRVFFAPSHLLRELVSNL